MISEIYSVFSPSGREEKMREYIADKISGIFDKVESDNFGNLVARSGNGDFCIECSMDSCGIMIVHIEDGKAYFAGVGGINAEYLIGKKILFCDNSIGIVRYDGKTPNEAKVSDLYLECDSSNLKIGDFGVVKSGYCETGDKMFANGLGSKIGLAAVLETLTKFEKIDNLCVLFSSQKRLGARGIQAFLGANEFDKIITVEGVADKSIKACALVVADRNGVCNTDFKDELEKVIDNIAVTDDDLCMGNITASGKGAKCAALGIPVSHKDKNFECVKKTDFFSGADYLKEVIENLQNKR
ncbi:MAG: hypothetical protein IKW62_04955 [Clostridia bacterium]|nr:hypothetical protein [Clostridia bacterium]